MSSSPPIDRLVDDLVVERHDQRVLELHAVAPDVGDHVGDVDRVFAVGREIDFRENAAARAERQDRATCVSCVPGPARKVQPAGPRIRPADRLHGDGARGDHVLLDEGRRHLQRRRDVVEALGRCRLPAATRSRRRRPRADRGPRSRIPCDSADAARPGPVDVRLRWPPRRANPRATRPASRRPRASGCSAPGGGMTRPRSLRTAFSNTSACCADALGRDVLRS